MTSFLFLVGCRATFDHVSFAFTARSWGVDDNLEISTASGISMSVEVVLEEELLSWKFEIFDGIRVNASVMEARRIVETSKVSKSIVGLKLTTFVEEIDLRFEFMGWENCDSCC